MKNSDVIKAFVRGESGQSGTLTSTGEKLFSYETVIAQRKSKNAPEVYGDQEIIVLNKTKYSVTTSRQQSELQRTLDEQGKFWVYVTCRLRGTTEL